MTKKEKEKLLDDKWPEQDEKKRKAVIKILKKASKAGIFEYQPPKEHLACNHGR